METSLQALVEQASQDVGCEAVSVFLNAPEGGVSKRAAWVGEEPRESVPFNVTPLGECAARGTAVHREVEHTKPLKYHSHLYLPLLATAEDCLGAVWFAAVAPRYFSGGTPVDRALYWAQILTKSCVER